MKKAPNITSNRAALPPFPLLNFAEKRGIDDRSECDRASCMKGARIFQTGKDFHFATRAAITLQ